MRCAYVCVRVRVRLHRRHQSSGQLVCVSAWVCVRVRARKKMKRVPRDSRAKSTRVHGRVDNRRMFASQSAHAHAHLHTHTSTLLYTHTFILFFFDRMFEQKQKRKK